MGAGCQGFGPSSTAFPGHKQGAGWEAGQPGLEPASIWDPGRVKMRTLAARLLHGPCVFYFFRSNSPAAILSFVVIFILFVNPCKT